MDTAKNYDKVYDLIKQYDLSAEEVLNLFANYCGLQVFTDDFVEFVKQEVE